MTGIKCADLAEMFSVLGFQSVSFALFAISARTKLPKSSFGAVESDELCCELCELSLEIQGEPSYKELLLQLKNTPLERRSKALSKLRGECLCLNSA